MQNQVPCLINFVKDDLLPENVYSIQDYASCKSFVIICLVLY